MAPCRVSGCFATKLKGFYKTMKREMETDIMLLFRNTPSTLYNILPYIAAAS